MALVTMFNSQGRFRGWRHLLGIPKLQELLSFFQNENVS